MKVIAVLFLVAAVLAGCVHIEAPPPQFTMYCDVCERVTVWRDAYPYLECSVSRTRW